MYELLQYQDMSPDLKLRRLSKGATGVFYDIFNFQPWMINIHDIATSLSKKCRWNGGLNTDEIFSVAQHSVYGARSAGDDPHDRLAMLLHDGSEGFMVDLITPQKLIFENFRHVENDVQGKIYQHFGVDMHEHRTKLVHMIDHLMLGLEANEFGRDLANNPAGTSTLSEFFPGHTLWSCVEAKKQFIAEFNLIMTEILTR
jgi:hypothetical protein